MAGDGPVVANTTTESPILSPDSLITLPGNYWYVGKTLRTQLRGKMTILNPTPGTLTFRVRWGTVAAALLLTTGTALTLNAAGAVSTGLWQLDATLQCRVAGSGATFMFLGRVEGSAFGTVASVNGVQFIPGSNPAAGSGVDVTAPNPLNITAQWSVANAANTLTVHGGYIEELN